MQKPTGNNTAPSSGEPVCTVTVTAKTAASASSAPAMKARMRVSRVDMKTLASPASTIFDTNSEGARYAIAINLLAGSAGTSRHDSEATCPLFIGGAGLSLQRSGTIADRAETFRQHDARAASLVLSAQVRVRKRAPAIDRFVRSHG